MADIAETTEPLPAAWAVRQWQQTPAMTIRRWPSLAGLGAGYRARSQALVEFALTVPIRMGMLLGIIDFGRAFYGGVVAEQAAREGARLGAGSADNPGIPATSSGCTSGINCTPIETQVQNALGLCSGCYNTLFLAPADVTINIGGRDSSNATYGRYQGFSGNPSNAVCSSDACDGGSIQIEVTFNVPLYTGFLLSRLGFDKVAVRGYATAMLF